MRADLQWEDGSIYNTNIRGVVYFQMPIDDTYARNAISFLALYPTAERVNEPPRLRDIIAHVAMGWLTG